MNLENIWISTFTGKKFHPFNPQPEMFCIEDIAHSLAMQCRFNGHTSDFVSVAYHSIEVAGLCPEEDKLEGLMHDCAEAYFGDIPKPIKDAFPGIKEMEDKIMEAAAAALGFRFPLPHSVKLADHEMLGLEAASRLKNIPRSLLWEGFGIHHKFDFPWAKSEPVRDKHLFIQTYERLKFKTTPVDCGSSGSDIL